jgi:hypothetical protein
LDGNPLFASKIAYGFQAVILRILNQIDLMKGSSARLQCFENRVDAVEDLNLLVWFCFHFFPRVPVFKVCVRPVSCWNIG